MKHRYERGRASSQPDVRPRIELARISCTSTVSMYPAHAFCARIYDFQFGNGEHKERAKADEGCSWI